MPPASRHYPPPPHTPHTQSCLYKQKTAKVRGALPMRYRKAGPSCWLPRGEAPRAWATWPSSEGGPPGLSPKMPADPPTPWLRFPAHRSRANKRLPSYTAERGASVTRGSSRTHGEATVPAGAGRGVQHPRRSPEQTGNLPEGKARTRRAVSSSGSFCRRVRYPGPAAGQTPDP